jgi:hypothetical protein
MTLLGRIFHQGCERETTLGWASIGLFAGAVVGTVLVGLLFAVLGVVEGGSIASVVQVVLVVTFYGLFVWLAGLAVIGAPGWWILHSLGARCQQAAMIYGGALLLIINLSLPALIGHSAEDSGGPTVINGQLTAHGWVQQLKTAIPMALIGAAVGWVVAKIAYRPARS